VEITSNGRTFEYGGEKQKNRYLKGVQIKVFFPCMAGLEILCKFSKGKFWNF